MIYKQISNKVLYVYCLETGCWKLGWLPPVSTRTKPVSPPANQKIEPVFPGNSWMRSRQILCRLSNQIIRQVNQHEQNSYQLFFEINDPSLLPDERLLLLETLLCCEIENIIFFLFYLKRIFIGSRTKQQKRKNLDSSKDVYGSKE